MIIPLEDQFAGTNERQIGLWVIRFPTTIDHVETERIEVFSRILPTPDLI